MEPVAGLQCGAGGRHEDQRRGHTALPEWHGDLQYPGCDDGVQLSQVVFQRLGSHASMDETDRHAL
ncbi:hypothetical protein SAMN05443507_1461 [Alicyclobacillus tolerans]|uniref:Uncharacterized protein n=1 Tax=Alicyclobacillus tolerans TaxID=90970 RepID=A0A1M6Y9B1_9BACL|nr:hypothetical protein SAMN05443507_1461 [Alicyclobacillus montanus]